MSTVQKYIRTTDNFLIGTKINSNQCSNFGNKITYAAINDLIVSLDDLLKDEIYNYTIPGTLRQYMSQIIG